METMITVPYQDFVNGMQAIADLHSLRQLIIRGGAYCSKDIKAILGIYTEKGDGDAVSD